LSDWVTEIEKYFSGTSQYPLMVVLSSEEYKEVLAAFSNTPKIKVSDYCIAADKEPDTLQLEYDVRRKTGRYLLVGLGDYLACKNNIVKKTLSHYKDLALQSDGRVAILLSPHMYPFAKEIADGDPRVRTRILLPRVAPHVDMVNSSTLVYGIKAYLEACEKCESVGSVKTALNIQNVNVINPESAFDELKHRFPNELNRLSQNAGTPENWGEMLMNLNKSKKSMAQYLAAQGFASLEYIFLDYAKRNDYKAWLYFINLKLNKNSQSYLGFVAAKSDNLNSLLQSAKTAILDVANNDRLFKPFYEQRKKMLKGCADVDMADFVPKIHVRGADRIAYLTDNTKVERQAVVVSLCEGANSHSLEVSYPDLYLYLQDYQFEDDKFTKYFAAYKKCKLENRVSGDFVSVVADYAVTRPYNSLPARSSLISSLDDGSTVLIFLDAFGVEYLGYVKEKCVELKLRFASKIARADLPTITSLNRGFYDEWHGKKETPIKDLDELKHHPERGYDYNNSPYPIHLVEELDVIKTALERAKTKLLTGEYRKVLIVSDHGASRLAVISPDVLVSKNHCEAKSSGRYCMGDELPVANNIVAEVEGQYAVIADYSRFEGSRTASVETHGGATLEEVLVPIVEITLVDNNIEVALEKNVVEISYKTVPTLILIVTPDCDNVTASVNKTTYKVEKLEKSKYKVEMPELKKGKYTIDIFENQNKIGSKEFTVKSKGFAERDIF
jgi:hypothetical protein